ncbi:MAG TPA: nuclear transport factor 2 family protein [Gemmataceae bacterium]|nr:nuclear transport factor 2 family protein [Gemmataceae bacterium]
MSTTPGRPSWILIMTVMLLIILAIVMKFYIPQLTTRPGLEVEHAIRGVLDAQAGAWNRGDLDGFMEGYWKSPDLKFFSGKDITSGWEATLKRYRDKYQGAGREMGQLTFSDVEVKSCGPNDAWARGRWKLVKSKETVEGLYTLILRRLPEGWRIVHDHTSAGPSPAADAKPSP